MARYVSPAAARHSFENGAHRPVAAHHRRLTHRSEPPILGLARLKYRCAASLSRWKLADSSGKKGSDE